MGFARAAVNNVSDIIHNPVYTGIGPFPRLIEDDQWLKCMTKSVEENGPEQAFLHMTHAVEKSFGIPALAEARSEESLAQLRRKIEEVGAEHFFADLLKNLRRSLAPLS